MKIHQYGAVMTAVFLAAVVFAPGAHAADKKDDTAAKKKPEVTVSVKAGDTLTSIAEAHKTDYIRLFNANESLQSPDLLNEGDSLRVPEASEELPDRYSEWSANQAAQATAATAATTSAYEPVYSDTYTPGSQAVYATDSAGNTYFAGYCTWYAKERRPDLPNMLGNGGQWAANAAAQGYATGSDPRVGAIAETAGHVAYVESVNPDGTITISDMNGRAGFGNVGTQTVSPGNYTYIY